MVSTERCGARMDAGTILRDARRRAGLTRTRLAEQAGVTQSVISAYESGSRQPSLRTLTALVEATGHELQLDVRRVPARLDRLAGPVGRRVRRDRSRLRAVAERHGLTHVRVFGSVARGDDRPDSDLDLLADLPPGMSLVGLGRARTELEAVVGVPVDVVPATDLKADVRVRVEADAIAL